MKVPNVSPEDDAGFGVYVHWPFCLAKCPYCDFNSHVRQGVDEVRYRNALVAELAHARGLDARPRRATSVFFGGGTPSLMTPATVAAVIEAVERYWGLDAAAEVTLEANPTSVEAARFAGYRAAGVNRVSLGVQALDDNDLSALGREHTVAEALAALGLAQATFERVSIDLIYARPDQKLDAWARELNRALGLGTGHLSLYQLTIEPGTVFQRRHDSGDLMVPEDDDAAKLFVATRDITAAAGLPAYEVSNHARPGEEGRHNLTYWRYGPYVGVGPGAHGRLSARGGTARLATVAHRTPEAWLRAVERDGHGLAETAPVDARTAAEEALLMGLRLGEGVPVERVADILDHEAATTLAAQGLLRFHEGRLVATADGMLVLNTLIADLVA